MSANHRYTIDTTCPGCGASGAVIVLEDAGPPFTDLPRREITSADNKFDIVAQNPPTAKCAACGELVRGLYEPCLT
jgi:hypothetical protein